MSVNNKVRNNIGPFQYGFSGISDLSLVDNCRRLSQNDYNICDEIGCNESKQHFSTLKLMNNEPFIICLQKQFLEAKIGVYSPENLKFSGQCRA